MYIMILPPEIIDIILIYTKNPELCIQLKRYYPLIKLNYTMDLASYNGYLSIVQYLHSMNKNCTKDAMDWASENSHLPVVEFLHSINKDCAMNWAN